jgi:tRNA(Leu) C34 or U34 (ribose-2'-O)-methylase TrmL
MFDLCFCYPTNAHLIQQWDFVLSHWKPAGIYCITSDPQASFDSKPLQKTRFIRNTDELPTRDPLILMAPRKGYTYQGRRSLKNFWHPSKCTYLFGSDHSHIGEEVSRQPDEIVYIPTDDDVEMYSHVAAAVTLYDRKVKRG